MSQGFIQLFQKLSKALRVSLNQSLKRPLPTQWLNNFKPCPNQQPRFAVIQPQHTGQIYLNGLIRRDERKHEMEPRAAGGSQQGATSAGEGGRGKVSTERAR